MPPLTRGHASGPSPSPSWPRLRLLAAILLAVWSALIARVTLVPDIGGTGTIYRLVAAASSFLTGGRVVPTFLVVEGIGNVLMFVPYGFLWTYVLVYPGRTQRRWLLIGALAASVISLLTTIGIETTQGALFPHRVSEARDLLHNTLGGVIGAALAVAAGWRVSRRRPSVN